LSRCWAAPSNGWALPKPGSTRTRAGIQLLARLSLWVPAGRTYLPRRLLAAGAFRRCFRRRSVGRDYCIIYTGCCIITVSAIGGTAEDWGENDDAEKEDGMRRGRRVFGTSSEAALGGMGFAAGGIVGAHLVSHSRGAQAVAGGVSVSASGLPAGFGVCYLVHGAGGLGGDLGARAEAASGEERAVLAGAGTGHHRGDRQ
jgi:hypothetical protein